MAMGLAFHRKLNVELDSSLRHWKPRWDVIRSIYAIGLPAIISQALLTVMTYSLNLILAVIPDVGQNAVTVYGLYYKIQQLIIFAAFGVRDAITPVVAFNYGLRSRARVRQGIRWGLGYTAGLMLLGCAGVELFAQPLAGLFSLSATTHAMCVDCMRIVSLGFLFAGLCIAFQGVFQALECGVESLVKAGIVCTAPGLGADPPGDRPGKCSPRLVAPGPWRSRHVGGGAGAVREAREEEDGVLKEKRRFTMLK